MKKSPFFIAFLLLVSSALFSQVSINTDNSQPDPSAGLDVNFNNKGLLIPRMTQTEIEAIIDPANGLVVFCTTSNTFFSYISNVNKWKEIAFGPNYINPGGGGFVCGSSLTINHVAGAVAPVDKTVTYGTVTNIPGELTKCWITQNLGASQEATAVSDATEASAGWYWQFNRMQGYKHDGSTRTPNTTWITSINENLDWQAANDPCTHELGSGWRLPSFAEWTNIDASGNWTNWNGPWNSALKMHAAGFLSFNDGSLSNRGTYGHYWGSAQNNATNGWLLSFYNSYSYLDNYGKTYGFSLRCIQ